jgi:hypothetical protein
MKKKRKTRIVMDESSPEMTKADKALAREEAKFQAGRLRAIAKDKMKAEKDKMKAEKALAREEAKFQAGRLRAIAKDKAETMKKK